MKVKSLLIANRGEIAIRICETAKKMGIKTYGIKTPKEPNAYYLNFVDEVVDFSEDLEEIPEFLDVERLIEAAKTSKADAIHPGYGFLSENPYFAKRCEEEKILFIGPSADIIYKMGNKTIAKQLARKHNVPLLQGSHSNVRNPEEAVKIANKIGFPVILKAAAGGGGRGMRIVEKESQIEKMFRLATSEAEKAFNDGSVFIEKYVRNPKHIEFQVFGDKHGNYIHLGERECSIQRKHQKLLEEAPSSALNEALRAEMGEAAIRIAKSVKYFTAGTVEFLLDDDKNYYFMEMNTRIQVEHPVTEKITNLDLIELQIKTAAGEELPIKQEDVKLDGWAIECRINAEDVQAGFSPFLGVIEKVQFPKSKHIRIDTGISDKSVVTPYFDSMIAKLIVHSENREKAIQNTINALNKFWIKGIKTTIPFCKAVLSHPKFKKGDFNTSFIEKEMKEMFYKGENDELLAAFFATFNHAASLETDRSTFVDFEKGKNISPWVLNKRLKSL
ncbi:MAG: ATP-grasp domain-containing protein [Bacteroidales bacterium]|nr:ATP-grasp domain-containing protein [Bacteroidales bacterium]MBN2820615.1 ATP-grasp domain-containing protein [Bacteroidales bacterium]